MTKKDYELIATAIWQVRHENPQSEPARKVLLQVVEKLIFFLSSDNPRFNAQYFRDACDVIMEKQYEDD